MGAASTDPGVEMAHELVGAFHRRDVEALVALTAPDCVIVAQRSTIEGAFEGHEGVRRWAAGYYELIPDATVELERVVLVSRSRVVVLGSQSGSAPIGGAAFEAPLAAIADHEGGRLKRLVLLSSHEQALAAASA